MKSFTASRMEGGRISQTEVAAMGLQVMRYKNHDTKIMKESYGMYKLFRSGNSLLKVGLKQ